MSQAYGTIVSLQYSRMSHRQWHKSVTCMLSSLSQQSGQVYDAQFMHSGFAHDLQRWTVLLAMHWRHRSLPPGVAAAATCLAISLMLPASSSSPPHSSAPSIFRNCLRFLPPRVVPVTSPQRMNALYAVTSTICWKTTFGHRVVRFLVVYAPHI
jgi:hypothetical protein